MLNYESAATSAELYYQANTTYNYKYINGANSESFAWLFESKESATANDDSQNGMTTIVITKYITPDESIDYENLDPQVRYALWAENDQPLSTEIPLFVPLGGGMKVIENELRKNYIYEVNQLYDLGLNALVAGQSIKNTAIMLHQLRRELGVKYKNMTPEPLLSEIYKRNIIKYGDPLGPSIEYLINIKNKSWMEIIESASRTGGKDLGL